MTREGVRGVRAPPGWVAGSSTALYIGLIALVAQASGYFYILFPELGALGHDILSRPRGAWARAPLMLVLTPVTTAVVGTLITRHLPYGLTSVLLDVGFSAMAITVLRSPIAPAISAGLLPLTLGIRSFWYPPSLLIGTGVLAVIAALRARLAAPAVRMVAPARDRVDDEVEEAPATVSWVPFFVVFLILAVVAGDLTGWRLVLFPPLVVIGFEAFAHSAVCPWASRPIALALACGLTGTAGVLCVTFLGAGPLGAMCSILTGIVVVRALDLHVPPALAVGLLPFVMTHPSLRFPAAVLLGVAIETAVFLGWRHFARAAHVRGGSNR
jgi:hypothetical protein